MHLFHNSIIRAYDIRGVFNETLFAKDAFFLAKSFAKYIIDKNLRKIVVGYDGRQSSPILKDNLINGLVESGIEVIDIGLCPTPMLYYAINHFDYDAGIMVTGSHNPKNHNGFKIALKSGPFYGDDIIKLADIAKQGKFFDGKGSVESFDISDHYIKRVLQILDDENIETSKLRIAWDCGNGATGNVIREITKKITSKNYLIYDEVDGNFPNHHPDPTEVKNLKDIINLVKNNECNLGLAFDGDGDRIGVIDDEGEIIWGDQLMILLSRDVLKKNNGAKIIADVKASNILFNEIEKAGGVPVMWKTGHSLIKAKMKLENSPLAGEMSGHIFFADQYYGFDDAIYAAIRLIKIIAQSNKKLSDYRKEFPKTYSTPEIRIECEDEKKFTIIEEIKNLLLNEGKKFIDIDGIRYVDNNDWWLLRASNTQPVLVARCESLEYDNLIKLKKDLCNILTKFKIQIPQELK